MHSISNMLDPGMQNQTKSVATTGNSKIDCAKECPCGVPVIPVPDQWLEVMVTGGFKVWHIIFIIIAFVVTLIVVYCCFHRCRIPRTKQEIEADLMRTNITNKFRDYLQALPNEPTSFLEALKKVQDLEEKSEKDDAEMARDAGARKRLGWLKLKGKGGAGDKEAGQAKLENGAEKSPEEQPLVGESEPQKTVIPPAEPAASVAPPAEPDIVDLLEPNNAEATLPKSPIGPATSAEAAATTTTTTTTIGDQESKSKHQPRRRKQKPNLSRTKRAKENPNGGDVKSPRSPPEMEPASTDRLAHTQAVEKPVTLARPPTSERIQPAPSRSHPPKHHAHRVRIESKMSPRPPDV